MIPPTVTETQAQTKDEAHGATLNAWERVEAGESLLVVAKELGIPESTLRDRVTQLSKSGISLQAYRFFWSFEGAMFLKRLVYAMVFFMAMRKSHSIETISTVLRRAGLGALIGTSYGAIQAIKTDCEKIFLKKTKEEFSRLVESKMTLYITICADETWLSEMCLIAIEPISNFVLLAKYSEYRTAKAWKDALQKAHPGLHIVILQTTSDEAKALIKLAQEHLEGQHSPDLFHIQHEVCKGLSLPISNSVKCSEAQLAKALEGVGVLKDVTQPTKNNTESLVVLAEEIDLNAFTEVKHKLENVNKALEISKEFRSCLEDLSKAYHPIDIETGSRRLASDVMSSVYAVFGRLDEVASSFNSEKISKHVEKARNVCDAMNDALRFNELFISAELHKTEYSSAEKWQILNRLIPAAYLRRIAKQQTYARKRDELNALAARLEQLALSSDPLFEKSEAEIRSMFEDAKYLATIFQRSSSCVEGLNGVLSIKFQSSRGMSEKELEIAIAMHNFVSKRGDGTTAVERLFDMKANDIFSMVVNDGIELPPGRAAA